MAATVDPVAAGDSGADGSSRCPPLPGAITTVLEGTSSAWEAMNACSIPTRRTLRILRAPPPHLNAEDLCGGRDTGVSVEGFGRVTWIVEYRVQRCNTERP